MAITVATGGSALPIIASVAVGTAVSAGIGAGVAAIQGGSGEEILNAAFDGASDGFMWGGIFAFGGATINAIKVGGQSVNIASSANVKATNVGKGYDSFSAFKKANGLAGEGKQWHHIVEQCQIQKSGFSPSQIHNTKNIIAVDSNVHRAISAKYSSLFGNTGMTTRNMLQGKSYAYQYNFGIEILKKLGVL